MKTTQFVPISLLVITFPLIQLTPARAITFTGDTHIGAFDMTFDGMDIIVSNCTLTIDGPHGFEGIQVLAGGIITHTFAASGILPSPIYTVTAEPHLLSSNTPSSLSFSNVNAATILVRDSSASVLYTNGTDYQVVSQANGLTGLQLLPGSSIAEGSTTLVDYQYSSPSVPSGLTLTVSNNVLIRAGGTINVDGKGFGSGQGPGAGRVVGNPATGGGAGHGGNGGNGVGFAAGGAVYDSLQQPTQKGSGGAAGYNGPGGSGGGAVRLVIGGALLVDGSISANGLGSATSRSGGGSGGSIWVSAQTIAGSGLISANGGEGELPAGGGGGGGRLSIQSADNVFTGQLTAFGGNGNAYGGAGTIYTQTRTPSAQQVLVDNAGHPGLTTISQGSEQSLLTLQAGALVSIPGPQSLGALLVRSNASLIVSNDVSSMQTLTISGDATIEAGGVITADGMGFPANQGRGAGLNSQSLVRVGGGGGYGGNGGNAGALNAWGGSGYGSFTSPTDSGSGGGSYLPVGPGSAGGGPIHLSVAGTLIVNGKISANGNAGAADGSGGGSGGSIWINAKMLAGAGTISANGGDGNGSGLYAGGGGGGGRIAADALNLFLGKISAQGGNGYIRGGAGTVYLSSGPDIQPRQQQLVIDNGGTGGTNTLLSLFTTSSVDLTVSGGAVLTLSGQLYLHSLLVTSNSWIVATNLFLSTMGDALIEAGGGMVADGNGYGASQGPGAGRYTVIPLGGYVGGGGGYGGYGGNAAGTTSVLTGGGTYGLLTEPTTAGSGGGAPSSNLAGGAGGGAIHLMTSGALKLEGMITANGNPGLQGGGGGSGGSIWVSAGSISGNGAITANGGNGDGNGGGGGGGRILLDYGTNYFSGGLAARGGIGTNRGGAGTVYSRARNTNFGELVIDNGGQPGTNTSWLVTGTMDLTVTGGAVVAPPPSQVFSNLVIGSNSALVLSSQQQPLTVRGNVLIQPGGAITADGAGYGPGEGPGAGRVGVNQQGSSAGGGGYGGNGGSGTTATGTGGATYGSLTQPIVWGSGGGSVAQSRSGGAGGGAIQMTVTGTVTVLGRISANGTAGQQGGGGSGGSIYLTASALLGSGQISANGGRGGLQSGGGGGGRVAIILQQPNAFSGSITAFGGSGSAAGGAGTVLVGLSPSPRALAAQVLVDNDGQLGTNTSWTSASGPIDLTIRGGGVAAPPLQQVIQNLFIETNGWLRLNQSLTVMGNATVAAGGGIVADGMGYTNGQGTGAGHNYNTQGYGYLGGGGGYGGYGASAAIPTPAVLGGLTYGSLIAPFDRGSSGGAYPSSYGGAGGGAIRLIISGTLDLDGELSAQGSPGAIPGAGGGSGGSIWVATGSLTGSGSITANGGSGNGYGGGGGGGRIALEYGLNSFSGPITAFGGEGSSPGGAGTIYLRPKSQPMGKVIVDNGGQFGSATTIGALNSAFDLAIKDGASVEASSSPLLLSNLDIGWGASLSVSKSLQEISVTVLHDALIEAGGSITLDGKGYSAMSGPGSGATTNSIGSGGGYGGNGGASSLQPGGGTYGSALLPIDPGSSGGLGYGTWTNGSEGGGALRLSVGDALTVNGSISADGADGNPGLQDNAGGGSGGSIWISANVLTGAGQILATGGAGELFQGGGGGGGRIAIYSPANLFSGLVSAAGASGFAPGQDGTIYSASYLPLGLIAPTASVLSDSNGSVMSWQMIPGITYQAYCSTNLVDWMLYGVPTVGSNGMAEMILPRQNAPQMFFRIRASQ
ncbi:MAG TPA: hypothetical protein VFE51_06005 [Verrucomicrobiae bacterium]|nr:hypothetical protein [Verrucomicrobiae bacterium]